MSQDDIQIPNALKTSDRVRELRGMTAINPNKIEGFDNEPIPTFDNPFPAIEHFDEDPVEAPALSPLIPQAPQVPLQPVWGQSLVTTGTATNTSFTLSIPQKDYLEIWYQGSKVAVSGQLQIDVERLILEGIQKEIREKLDTLKPRRVRGANAGGGMVHGGRDGAGPSDAVLGVARPSPVKRGRPKGSLNKKTLAKQESHVEVAAGSAT